MCFTLKSKVTKAMMKSMERFAREEKARMEALPAEIARINQLESLTPGDNLTEQDIRRQWEEYWERYDTLEPLMRKRIAYQLARRGWSGGHSGFHSSGFQSTLPFPIKMYGWFYFYNSSHIYKDGGVMFKIDPECFGLWNAQLYYFDDDGYPCYKSGTPADYADKEIELIKRFSSGISDIHIEKLTCADHHGKTDERWCIVFRIDSLAVKKKREYEPDPTTDEPPGDFIFCLPRAGEFNCTLGQVAEGKTIPLHHDSFCMK